MGWRAGDSPRLLSNMSIEAALRLDCPMKLLFYRSTASAEFAVKVHGQFCLGLSRIFAMCRSIHFLDL